MANHKPTPPALQELIDNTKLREIYLKWPVLNRCEQAYDNITFDGWPVERTCAVYDISSTWYRLQAMRHSTKWNKKHQAFLDSQEAWVAWEEKVFTALSFTSDDECVRDKAYDVFGKLFYPSTLSKEKEITLYDEDGDEDGFDYTNITIEDLKTFKDQFWINWNNHNNNNDLT